MIYNLFRLAIVFIPFTAIDGWAYLGESRHEIAAYIFVAALMLSVVPVLAQFRLSDSTVQSNLKVYAIPQIMALFFSVVLISFIANFVEIKDSFFQGRNGLEKFISSNLVVIYGFALAVLTYFISAGRKWDELLVKPILISVALCAIFSFFEIGARWYGVMGGAYDLLTSIFYGNVPAIEWDLRLRSVAFEPPDFANTAGYLWPWLLSGVIIARGSWRIVLLAAFIALNAMLVLSDSRTSLVVVAGLAAIFVLLKTVFLPTHKLGNPDKMVLPVTLVCALVIPAALVVLVFFFDDIVFSVISGDRVSNISRLASITAAFRMFEARPLFGFGWGQYAFHMTDYMPYWGYYSWEVKAWLLDYSNYWPSVYSIYGRLAADMGLLGPLMWVSIWLWLARSVLVETLLYRKTTGDIPFAAYPLIMSCFGVLLAGVPCDSVRAPMIWINMGLACRYLYEMKRARQQNALNDGINA